MALLLLLLVVTSVAAQAKGPVAPPKPQPEPTPTPPTPSPKPKDPCAGYECPSYDVIDVLEGDVETRRYGKGMWVRFPVPSDDFKFMAEYGNEMLGNFFQGHNYEHKVVKQSTPLRIEFDLWDETQPRNAFAGYFIPQGEQTTAPAPVPPTQIDVHDEVFVFAKKFNVSEVNFETVSKAAASTMMNLVRQRKPFNREKCYLAMYSYPKEGGGERMQNEIWVTRTIPVYDAADGSKMLRSAGRNASKVLDYVQRRLLR